MAQPLNNITIAAPGFAGINTQDSPISTGTEYCLIAENAVIDQFGRIGARKGYEVKTASNTLLGTAPLQGIFEFLDTDGSLITVVTGNNKIFKVTTVTVTDDTLVDITPAGASITADNWKGVTFNGFLFLFQASQAPISYDGTTCALVSAHANYSGTVPTGNEVIAGFGRLWAVNGAKTTIFWSDLLNGFSWDEGSSGSINLNKVWSDQSDEIQALATHNGYLIIFGKRQILVYQGPTDPATMSLADSISGIGCLARDSVQNTGQDLIFLADSGVRSFNRVIQEKSLPMRDISKNVRTDLMSLALIQSAPIKSAYSEDEAFYLLSFPTSNAIYCFDMRGALENGSHRATLWTGITPRAFCTKRNGTLLFGANYGLAEYKGYNDNTATYSFRYFSSYLDFGAQSNLKFLKKLNITIIGGQSTTATLNWGYDYTSAYSRQAFTFRTATLSEYGEEQYGLSNTVVAGSQGAATVTVEGSPDVHYTVDFETVLSVLYNTEYVVFLDADGYYYVNNNGGGTRTRTVLYTKSADYGSEYNASVIIQEPRVNTSGSGTVVQIGLEAQINNAPFSIQKIDIHALLGRIV
jgi:hypothetical protein